MSKCLVVSLVVTLLTLGLKGCLCLSLLKLPLKFLIAETRFRRKGDNENKTGHSAGSCPNTGEKRAKLKLSQGTPQEGCLCTWTNGYKVQARAGLYIAVSSVPILEEKKKACNHSRRIYCRRNFLKEETMNLWAKILED